MPNSSDRSAITRNCWAVAWPASKRSRIMKLPGVGTRKNSPCHLKRCLSASVISCHLSSLARRARSSRESRPFFSSLISSILFLTTSVAHAPGSQAEELTQERLAGAAAGAGLGAQADGFDGGLAVADGGDDGPLADAVAIADLRIVGQAAQIACGVAASRCAAAPNARPQAVASSPSLEQSPHSAAHVRHSQQDGPGYLLVAQHQLLVDAALGVEVADRFAVGGLIGLAHHGQVDAHDLERGGQARALIRRRLARQHVGQHARLLVDRFHQAIELAAMLDALAHAKD